MPKLKKLSNLGLRQRRQRISMIRKQLNLRSAQSDLGPAGTIDNKAGTSGESHTNKLLETNQYFVGSDSSSNDSNSSHEVSKNEIDADEPIQHELRIDTDSSEEESGSFEEDQLNNYSNDNETDSESINNDDEENQDGNDPLDDNPPPEIIDPRSSGIRALKNTFLSTNMTHAQQKAVLQTLRAEPFFLRYLPKDPRTVVNTPSVVVRNVIQNLCGGRYIHFDCENLIKEKLKCIPERKIPNSLYLDFSTDGGRVFKSGGLQFWPIQFRLFNILPKLPMTAGIFVGKKKPSNPVEFFEQFVFDILAILNNGGIYFQNRRLPVHIRCFIADAPARSFALNHVGHMAENACSKCTVEGSNHLGTMIFSSVRNNPRTDEDYRREIDEDHHKGPTLLSRIIGPVTQVPFETMHLIYLGITKKILSALLEGKYAQKRLRGRSIDILDARMKILVDYCPSDFARRPAPLSLFNRYKATEFRQLLLYTSPAVLRNIIPGECYKHIMMLNFTIRMLSFAEASEEQLEFCEAAHRSFVEIAKVLYGERFLSYNVHGLLHVVDDVRNLGSIETYSAFCFENHMRELTRNIRKPERVLEQYYKRVKERNSMTSSMLSSEFKIVSKKIHFDGPISQEFQDRLIDQFKILEAGGVRFSSNLRDHCCILKNSIICIVKNILKFQENYFLVVSKFNSIDQVYEVGCSSDEVGVYLCKHLSNAIEAIPLEDVSSKCYLTPLWSSVEGEEERQIEGEFICTTYITKLLLPQRHEP